MPKPSYNPTFMLREFVTEQGYDPGPAPSNNAEPGLVMVIPGTPIPGGVPTRTESDSGYDHPTIGSPGSPAECKHSPRTNGANPGPM